MFSAAGNANVISCLESSDYVSGKYDEGWVTFLDYVENKYECAGFCDKFSFYSFTDIGDGPPPKSCRDDIIWEFGSPFGRIGIFGFMYMISGFLMMCAWYLSFGFCCRKYESDVVIFKSKIEFF